MFGRNLYESKYSWKLYEANEEIQFLLHFVWIIIFFCFRLLKPLKQGDCFKLLTLFRMIIESFKIHEVYFIRNGNLTEMKI